MLSRAGNQREDEDASPELTVTSLRAYFHTRPDSGARQSTYLIRGDRVEGLEVTGNWIRVAYKSRTGQVTVGWLPLAQLR